MSATPNARKDAARKYQRQHGGSYTAALAAVSPEADAAARRPVTAGSDPVDAVIRAVRHFDKVTADVRGQAEPLKRLRMLLSQHVSAVLRNGPGAGLGFYSVRVCSPRVGLWGDVIAVAFAQSYMLGTTGGVPETEMVNVLDSNHGPRETYLRVGNAKVRTVDLTGDDWGDVVVAEGAEGDASAEGNERFELIIDVKLGDIGSTLPNAVLLKLLDISDLAYLAWHHIQEATAEDPDISLDDLPHAFRTYHVHGTVPDAKDLAEKAMASALVRSSLDDPGSTRKVTIDDMKAAIEFQSIRS